MKKLRIALVAAAVAASSLPGQEDSRFAEIRARIARHEKITEDERDYAESIVERRNQENSARQHAQGYAKQHPPRESTGLVPLTELGKGKYEGHEGGLYPGGSNTPPAAHLQAGLRIAGSITPLDREGRKSVQGRIAMCSIGMSNTTQETRSFLKLAAADKELNPRLTLVDCAQGAQSAEKIVDPGLPYWKLVNQRLENAGVTPAQVQVIWLKEANGNPKQSFEEYARTLQEQQVKILHNLRAKFPNLKIAYVSSRVYGGWAGSPLNPEPYAYAGGFATKWLIADQIAGRAELNYDPAKGEARAPWIAWGPYLWADGLKARQDGAVWKREDLGPDGTHPSLAGREKVARMLMDFLKHDPTSRPWFVRSH
ncbi:MAG TPA: hypothetical protein VL285_07795 [Bryobacteraceae bacterium]|nr:hypothetical protein [Bryobacteraceae bacterium]